MSEPPTHTTTSLLTSASGLRVELEEHGALRRFACGDISLTLFVGNTLEGGLANIYLRARQQRAWTPLLGPLSPTRFHIEADRSQLLGAGAWRGINYSIALVLAREASAWFWHVRLENTHGAAQELDLTYVQDLALAPYGAVRLNEYYVSQYLDHTPLQDALRGCVIASRQNQAVDGRYPWCLIGSLRAGVSFATDALQFLALAGRRGAEPAGLAAELPGRRLQHEHSLVAIRDAPLRVEPRARIEAGFFGAYAADHPAASSQADLERLNAVLALREAAPVAVALPDSARAATRSLFGSAALLKAGDLERGTLEQLFGSSWRHEERGSSGELLSFFCDSVRHVVLRAKELQVLRPHGHLLRTGRESTPDETALTSTAWMSGVFHSMLTQGHVSINRFLSTTHGYLGLFRSHGQRVFMQTADGWQLLDVPSAFEIKPEACRWVYRHEAGQLQLRAEAHDDPHELSLEIEISSGEPARFLITHHVAFDGDDGSASGPARWWRDGAGITFAPPAGSELARRFPKGTFHITPQGDTQFQIVGGDELLFSDGRTRQQPYVCIVTAAAKRVGLRIRGHLIEQAVPQPQQLAPGEPLIPTLGMRHTPSGAAGVQIARLADMAPWYAHNAWVHYLAPRGLEQYSGGGWGTRDVCQGPIEMLLALGHTAPIRDILLRVMAQQNGDGDWPQWFMFFERERDIRPGDSHGDIVFWPLLVLAQYLVASGDAALLEERVPYFVPRSAPASEPESIWQHVERALAVIGKRTIPGTALPAYGHGDWNDSLQPADPHLREHMCSAWTATLHVQTLATLGQALETIGRPREAQRLLSGAQQVRADFQRLLLPDGVLTGYAVFEPGGGVSYLLHPRDAATGVRYSALAMIHAILEDLFTPAQARAHLQLIEQQLSAPDGVRLFDRPMAYYGGPQKLFQRAETATFFGREIGLMYTHAHLRYAQALAHLGEAQRFFHALCQANPLGIAALVPQATLRQANCYYSSSDAAFADRYQASAEYERVRSGTIALDGGWRVYSSGAGIALGLICRRLLGLSCEAQALRVDPVMPAALDGLHLTTRLLGYPLELQYRVGAAGCGVNSMQLNDRDLSYTRQANPHRRGAALVSLATVRSQLTAARNVLRIDLG